MDVKCGEILLRKGLLGKKSKKWLVAVSKHENGPAQLEAFDNEEQYRKQREDPQKPEKHKHKVYIMENLKEDEIDKVSKSSSKEYYIDLPLKKEKITLLLESGEDLEEWYNAIVRAMTMNIEVDGIKENLLYQSQDSGSAFTFTVGIKETDASNRMNLEGSYNLIVTPNSLILEDKTSKETKCIWSFEFIRRYGIEKKTGIFTIEAGRRCSTGEGKFELCVTSSDLIALPNAIDMQVKKRAGTSANITAQLGMPEHKKPNEKSQQSLRRSQPLPLSLPSNEQLQKENRISLKSSQHPSQLTPEFKQELEEHISHPPPSPSTEKEPKAKEKSKSKGFTMFRKGDKKKSAERKSETKEAKGDSKQQNGIKGEGNTKIDSKREDLIYDEAVTDAKRITVTQRGGDNSYEEAEPIRQSAWKNMGRSGEEHEEDYDRIKKAALENQDKDLENFPPVEDEEEDEMYDHVLNMHEVRKKSIQNSSDSMHIYGFNSGKALRDIPDEEDYATPDMMPQGEDHTENDYEFEDDEDPYDDTAVNDNEKTQYTDAISVQQKPPVTNRPVPKRRAPVYEEVQ